MYKRFWKNYELKCTQYKPDLFLNDDGYCIQCNSSQIKSKYNKYINCDDTNQDGIQGRLKCLNIEDIISC